MIRIVPLNPLLLCFFLCATIFSAQQPAPFPVLSTVNAPTIAGRPVQLDSQGKLLPWPVPNDTGYSYSSHVLAQWEILWDQYNRQRLPWFYCCFDFDRTTFELSPDPNWVNSTGYLRAMMEGFIERLYPYTGDQRTLTFLESLVDYELENGRTPAGYAWARVPYASANPGAALYSGWSHLGSNDFLEPHVVGEDGYAYLKLFEMTGKAKYLDAAILCADALAKNFQPGDAEHSPWPVRADARTGKSDGPGMGPYSANVIEPIMLFDELIRIRQGDVAAYARTRAAAWDWFQKYPLSNNLWVGYFEDVPPTMANMNQVIPLEFARYVLLHPEKDPQWREHARNLIEWVKTTPKWPKYSVHGATVTTEQGDGIHFCCNDPNQCCDSHTARLAAVEALYFAATGDPAYREAAFRSFNWVTYFQGLPGAAHAPFSNQWWFTDEFSDGPRRLMDAFWAVPEWAPSAESHLLGSSSVVTKIVYGAGSVSYSTFDPESVDVLRLDFTPQSVISGDKTLQLRSDLSQPGYTLDAATGVLRIRHTARNVRIQGRDGRPPASYITFDNPHLAAGTPLGEYPAGMVEWGENQWRINVPECGFGTFNLALVDPNRSTAQFRFPKPTIFLGIDACNGGKKPATITLHWQYGSAGKPTPGASNISLTLSPGETRRLRTNSAAPVTAVIFDMENGDGLRFDNLAISPVSPH